MTDIAEAPELEKIPASDPRMQHVWAHIAKEAIKVGQMDHYATIARELHAPTVDELRHSGALSGHTHWSTYIYVEFDTGLDNGHAMEDFDIADFRAGLLALAELSDTELRGKVNSDSHRIVWDR